MTPDNLNICLSAYFDGICQNVNQSHGHQRENNREEALFLLTMSELEKMAGDQILGNRTARTPGHLFDDIEAHANDEYRHSRLLEKMGKEMLSDSPLTGSESQRLIQMTSVAKSFVTGYFGNPYLSEAKSRHVAYVHGALTIEQFPFQVYSIYLQKTKCELVRKNLPAIIADEHQHIQFGRRMRAELEEEQKMDLGKLHQIEKKMCSQLFSRLSRLQQDRQTESSTATFCERIHSDPMISTAWTQTLGHAEKRAADATQRFFVGFEHLRPEIMREHLSDEIRHQKMLHRSILLQRRKFYSSPEYQHIEKKMTALMFNYQNKVFAHLKRKLKSPQLVYFYATSLIENRVFKHYTELVQVSVDMMVTYALNEIMVDEIEHAKTFHQALKEHPDFNPDHLKEFKAFENRSFLNMNRSVLTLLDEVRSSMTVPESKELPKKVIGEMASEMVYL